MLCGIIALSDPAPWPDGFFDEFQSLDETEKTEVRNCLSDAPLHKSNIGGMVRCGLIKKCSLGENDRVVFEAFDWMATDGTTPPDYVPGLSPEKMDALELASPIINQAAILELYHGEFTTNL